MEIPIIYINLERSQRRKHQMTNCLDKFDVKYYRIEAIDSQKIKKNEILNGSIDGYKYTVKNNIILKPREKEIAIILSHMKALNFICDNNFEISVIIEDDISFQYIKNLNEKINEIIHNAPQNWKIIKLHTSSLRDINHNIELYNEKIFYTYLSDSAINSAGCYIIKKSTAKEILNKYCVNNIYTFPHADEYVVCECVIFSTSDIYMYTKPVICTQDNNLTCGGNYNHADDDSNEIIHNFWKKQDVEKNEDKKLCKNFIAKPQRFNIKIIKNTSII